MATKKSKSLKMAEKALEEMKKPVFVEKLELGEGEIYTGNLNDADRYQLLIRHINILESYIKNCAQFTSIQAICLQELCRKQGIEIDKIINK